MTVEMTREETFLIGASRACGCDAIGPPDPVDPPLPDYDADPAPGPLAAPATIPTLDALQREVAARWGSSAYGPAYLERRDPQRDAHHALLHVTKATGKLAGLLDDLDHAPGVVHAATIAREDAAKYIADLVICAARVASEWPGAAIDLLAAVEARLAEKLPAKAGGA